MEINQARLSNIIYNVLLQILYLKYMTLGNFHLSLITIFLILTFLNTTDGLLL